MVRKLFSTYNNRIRVEIESVRVKGKKYDYVKVVQPDFVEVLAISKKGILIERQYRYGVKDYVYELPAGYIEPGERPIDAARRELEEETGYYPSKIRFMFKAYQAASKISSTIYFYLAEELVKGEKNLDEGEILKSKFVSKDRFESMVRKGLINDQSAVAAYTYYKAYFKK